MQNIPNEILIMMMKSMKEQASRVKEVRRAGVLFSRTGMMFPNHCYIQPTNGELPLRISPHAPQDEHEILNMIIDNWMNLTTKSEWHFIELREHIMHTYSSISNDDGEDVTCTDNDMNIYAIFHRY